MTDTKVIVVENPSLMSSIDIRPQEILNVIFSGRKHVSWRYESPTKDIALKCLRHEIICADSFERITKSYFRTPIISKHGVYQDHKWFRFDPKSYISVGKMGDGTFSIGELIFDDGRATIARIKVRLVLSKPDREEFRHLAHLSIGTDRIKIEAEFDGVFNTVFHEGAGYLLNPPSGVSHVYFEPGQVAMLVEMHKKTSYEKECHWMLSGNSRATDNFGIKELNFRYVNGQYIQRFAVYNYIQNLPGTIEKIKLGYVEAKFGKSQGNLYYPNLTKTLNFWVTRERNTARLFDSEEEQEPACEMPLPIKRLKHEETTTPTLYRIEKNIITFEEIKGDLSSGAKVYIAFPPRPAVQEIVDPPQNKEIIMNKGSLLTIHLYKNILHGHFYGSDWSVNTLNHSLALESVSADSHRQRFSFKVCDYDCGEEYIYFRCGNITKRFKVILK